MFNPKFHLILSAEHFYPSTVICLGSQMVSLIDFLEMKLPPHVWYSADIDVIGETARKYNLQSGMIKKIGTASSLKKICSEIDQFLSGVFLAVKHDQPHEPRDVAVYTEDKPFRALNIDGVLLEIRAFDTSFFDVFSENEKIIKELSKNFKSNSKETNEYTWNDVVIIKQTVPTQFHPGETGVVCGMSKIEFAEIASKYHSELGSWIYTIELGDGSDIQVPENYLEKYQDKKC